MTSAGCWRLRVAALLASLCPAFAAAAEVPALTLEDVLRSSARAAPAILEARAREEVSRADRLAAEGAFDRRIEQSGLGWGRGFYNGRNLDTQIVQPLRQFGAEAYGGYRIGTGDFPVYQDEFATLNGGEFAAGVKMPLWRDRVFDDARFALRDADLKVELAAAQRRQDSLAIQHAASRAYWTWVARGLELRVYERLVDIALQRDAAFRAQLEQGDIAEISVVENYQNVLQRQAFARQALRDFEVAAVELSRYLRDAIGAPLLPDKARLPERFPTIEALAEIAVAAAVERALATQPALQTIEQEAQRAENRALLARNDLDPAVDLGLKMSRDLGTGSITRQGTELIAELSVSIPIERRRAKGALAAARADLQRLTFTRQRVRENLQFEVAQVVERIDSAVEFARLTAQEADQALRLEEAEWVRFREGASSFFLLNIREVNRADAEVRTYEARLEYFRALADYRFRTVDWAALGLTPDP